MDNDIELIKWLICILEKAELQGESSDYWRTIYIDEPEYLQILQGLKDLVSKLNEE